MDQWSYPNREKDPKYQSGTSSILQIPNHGLKDIYVLCTFNIKIACQNSVHGFIKNQWLYNSQDPPVSSKAPNEDLKDIDVLCTFKIEIESQNLDHGYIKDQLPYPNQDQATNPSQEPSASSKAPNQHLKDMVDLCIFKIKIKDQNLGYWCIKDHWPYPNQDQDAKPPSGTSSIFQS